jgi:cyanophycinase
MFISGQSDTAPRFGCVEIGPGMDFIPGTLIDTHFSQRGRIGRLITAVAHYPQDIGLGIDENTALVLDGSTFEVLDEGVVTVVDAGGMGFTTLPYARKGDPLTLHDVRVHVISNGFRFDLESRRPEEDKGRIEKNAAGAERAAKPEEGAGAG